MDLIQLLISFCGGAFGAAIGALASFILVGLTGIFGIVLAAAGVSFNWFGTIPFGPYLGPHVAFAGGAAAAVYARKRGYLASGKDIASGLLSLKKPDVLVVAGLFGMLGYTINYFIGLALPGKLDTVALTVFIVAIIVKVLFGSLGLKEIFGVVPEEVKKLGGRFNVNAPSWLPWMVTNSEKTIIAIAAGGVSAYVTYMMLQDPATAGVAAFFGFCLSAFSLLWLQFGVSIPVTHHITLVAAYAVVSSGGSLIWGFAGAVIAAFLGDFLSRLFHVYGDCHVDPPAMAIASGSFLFMAILPLTGLYEMNAYLIAGGIVAVAVLFSVFESFKKSA
jgi:hypothetical protein